MKAKSTAICPLCQKLFSAAELHAHIVTAPIDTRQYAREEIRTRYPDWVERDGACEPCWNYYVQWGELAMAMQEFAVATHADAM